MASGSLGTSSRFDGAINANEIYLQKKMFDFLWS